MDNYNALLYGSVRLPLDLRTEEFRSRQIYSESLTDLHVSDKRHTAPM